MGTDHKKVIIVSALTGALFLVWADVACRVIIPGSELPIGILTSVIGGPFFVYLMARRSYGFGGEIMNGIRAIKIEIYLSGNKILKDVTLDVDQGDFVGIIGPNGSGKSTFLKCVYRTLLPDNGAIFLESQAIGQLPHKKTAQKMAVVGQHNELQFDFTRNGYGANGPLSL